MFAPPRRGFSRIGRLSDNNVSAGNVSITVNRREASFLVTRGSWRAKGAPRWRNYRGVNERPSKFPLITVEKISLPLSRRSSPILVNFVNEKIMNTNWLLFTACPFIRVSSISLSLYIYLYIYISPSLYKIRPSKWFPVIRRRAQSEGISTTATSADPSRSNFSARPDRLCSEAARQSGLAFHKVLAS